MPLIWHIFRKDVRRLWPAVLISLVLLGELSHLDSLRQDWLATAAEGWLNLILPLTWACLIALLVQQEPLVGDRHFWITWPYRWRTLLASKALFVLAFVHLPALVADAAILAFHGFPPAQYVSRLLGQQVLLAATVTIPALGLATLFENIATFLLAALVLAGAAVYLVQTNQPLRTPWLPADEIRIAVAAGLLAVTAGGIVLIQYARRRAAPSRIAGAGAVVFAGLVFGYLPPNVTARIRSTLHPASTHISLGPSTERPEVPAGMGNTGGGPEIVLAAVPVALSGVSDTQEIRCNVLSAEMTGPNAQRYRTPPKTARGSFQKMDFDASLLPYGRRPSWLLLRLRRAALNEIANGPVTLRALVEVSLHRAGPTTWLATGAPQAVPGLGRCSSQMVESANVYQGSMLKVFCESPYPISPATEVRLWQPGTGAEWKQHLGDSAPVVSGPRESLLSPLNRLQTFFQLTSEAGYRSPGGRWMVPREALLNAKLAIVPDTVTAWSTADIELPDLHLGDYVLKAER